MDAKTYQAQIEKFDLTQADYAEKFYWRLAEPGLLNMTHYILGLGSEVGELQDALKKFLRDGKAVDTLNIKEELGDCLWYITRMATLFGTNIEDLQKMNVAKLENRHPNGFHEKDGERRDVKAEQLAMLKAVETEQDRLVAKELKRLLTEGEGGIDEAT